MIIHLIDIKNKSDISRYNVMVGISIMKGDNKPLQVNKRGIKWLGVVLLGVSVPAAVPAAWWVSCWLCYCCCVPAGCVTAGEGR